MYLESDDFGNFPHFNKKADGNTDFDHEVCLVIQDVQDNYEGLEDIEENRSHGQTLQGFTVFPELYVYREKEQNITHKNLHQLSLITYTAN